MSIQFSDVSGENVQILEEKSRARWNISFSGGYIFTERHLSVDDVISVQLDGSGHVSLGMMKRDPKTIKNFREIEDKKMLKLVTDLRVHRRTCDVIVKQRIEDGSRKINFEYSGQRIVVRCSKSETVWLVFCLRFGNVTAKMESPSMKFHSSCGENTEFTNKSRTFAKLRVENPASLCCICRHIYINESIQFKVRSIKDGDRPPSKFYLVMGVSKMDAKQLSANDPESFIVGVRALSPYRWNIVKKFEKEECEGDLRVGINSFGHLTYSHSSGVSGEADVGLENNRAVIVFELFRVDVKIQELITGQNYDYAESYDDVVPVSSQETSYPVYVDLIPDPTPAPPVVQNKQSPTPAHKPIPNPSETKDISTDDQNYEPVVTKSEVSLTTAPVETFTTKPEVKPKPLKYKNMLETTLVSVPEGEKDKKEMYWAVKEMPKTDTEATKSESGLISAPVETITTKPEVKQKPLEYKSMLQTTLVSVPEGQKDNREMYWEVKEMPKDTKVSNSAPVLSSDRENNNNKMNTVKELVERFARMGSDEEPKRTSGVLTSPDDQTKTEVPVSNASDNKDTPVSPPEGATSNSSVQQGEILGETFRSINVLLNLGKKGNKENKKKKKKNK